MTSTSPPSPAPHGPRALSSVLRDLDDAVVDDPGRIDLAAAVRNGNRRRRRRRLASAAVGTIAAAAVFGLGAHVTDDRNAAVPAAGSAQEPTRVSGYDPAALQALGYDELPQERLVTPGTPDALQPPVWIGPSSTSVVVAIDGDGCSGGGALEVESQDSTHLSLRYVEPEVPAGIMCAASAVTLSYEVDLAPPVDPQADVVLDLPWARTDSPADVPGQGISDLGPGEVQVPIERTSALADGAAIDASPREQVFVDAEDTQVRLRFTAGSCTTSKLRPPRENDQQVYLDVVTTDPGTCAGPASTADMIATLDAPLGDRQVIISQETRIAPTTDSPLG